MAPSDTTCIYPYADSEAYTHYVHSLAYANIFHTISALIMRFDLELVDTLQERDVDMARDHFVMKPTRGSKGVTVKVVKEYTFDEGRNY